MFTEAPNRSHRHAEHAWHRMHVRVSYCGEPRPRSLPGGRSRSRQAYVAGAIEHALSIGQGQRASESLLEDQVLTDQSILVLVPQLLAIGSDRLELGRLIAAVSESSEGAGGADGAVVAFLGLVRNHNVGRRVRYLEMQAYEPLALKTFERIAAEVQEADGLRYGWRCIIALAGSKSEKRASRSRQLPPIGLTHMPAADT